VPPAPSAPVQARRADIECFACDLEAYGRARATITRRLCAIAGFYRYAVEEDLLDHSQRRMSRSQLDYESHTTGLDRHELGARWPPPGLGSPGEHALISLLARNGLRVSEATGANIEALGVERGHRTSVSAAKGQFSWLLVAVGWAGAVRRGSSAGSPAAPGSPSRRAAHAV
jgi:integrase/recombinase XerD